MKYASAGDKQMQCKEKVPLTSVLIQPKRGLLIFQLQGGVQE